MDLIQNSSVPLASLENRSVPSTALSVIDALQGMPKFKVRHDEVLDYF